MNDRRPRPRRPAAAWLLGGALLGAAALALFAWQAARGAPGAEGARAARAEGALAPLAPSPLEAAAGARELSAVGAESGPARQTETAAERDERARFSGRGCLRGSVELLAPGAFPQRWALVLEPSRTLIGQRAAVPRRVEFEDGRSEFRVDDVALGGYDVHAETEGLNGLPVPVLLQRDASEAYVMLALSPAGALTGRVAHAEQPQDGVELWLIDAAGRRRSARSDANGWYRFESVLDGGYTLLAGHPDSPLAPARSLDFRAPGMTFPQIELPELFELLVRVRDDRGSPVSGAKISGTGTLGGRIEGESDASGELRARHLPAGRFRVRAERAGFGSAFQAIELAPGKPAVLELRLEQRA